MSPKISVLMSVYNEEVYLKDALDSILNQTFENFEFIIFDDKSADASLKILKVYAAKDPRIKIIENEIRQGLGANLCKGVDIASAPIIARMDADDISMPDRLEEQINFLNENKDMDIIGSYALDIDEYGNVIGTRKCPTDNQTIHKYIWTCPMIHPSVMFRKESILKAGSYGTEKRRQDYALWFRAVKAGLKFANINKPLIKYRFTESNFKKNNIKALFYQAFIGVRGCFLVKASPIAYLGVFVPLIKGFIPSFCKKWMANFIKRFDPRNV